MSRPAGATTLPARRHASAATLIAVALIASLASPVGADTTEPRFVTTWGTAGTSNGEFDFPIRVAVAPDGTVYVADTINHRIQYFTPTGTPLGTWGEFGTDNEQFNTPWALAVAPDGTVYVADTINHRIQYFTATGTPLGTWGSSGTGNGQFDQPTGLAVGPDGTVYVADTNNHRIQYFTPTGTPLGTWGSSGTGNGQFTHPSGLAVGPDGTVYVADSNNHRIQYFTPTGTPLGTWGEFGTDNEQFSTPLGVAVALDGTVYVADTANHRIQYFTPTGDFQGTWGTEGTSDEQFDNPHGVAVGPFGTIYVADTRNDRIQVFAFPKVTRAAGVNRFATAAAISQQHHPIPGAVDTVFVATGANFPDALAGAVAAAASGSPLLLTSSLPQHTADELDRLDPDHIVILGGTGVIPAATAEQLAAWGTITRLSGANRYETAVEISQHLYPTAGSADTVVVATGTGFADALAGATLAALGNGPVLLTQATTLPDVVRDEIQRLDPDAIIVLGGPAAVSAGVFDALAAIAPTSRISGANRYETAIAISHHAFPDGAGVVYLAVGTNFPDALAGAAQAAAWQAPVLLTPTSALPQAVIDEIERLEPHTIIILGGTAVISPAVETALGAILGT